MNAPSATPLRLAHLDYLKLGYIAENHEPLAQQAADKRWSHLDYLERLLEGEYLRRQAKAVERRIQLARFPVIKTVEQFQWNWPEAINELKVKNLFRLGFVAQKTNVVFLGPVGTGTMPGPGLCRVV